MILEMVQSYEGSHDMSNSTHKHLSLEERKTKHTQYSTKTNRQEPKSL